MENTAPANLHFDDRFEPSKGRGSQRISGAIRGQNTKKTQKKHKKHKDMKILHILILAGMVAVILSDGAAIASGSGKQDYRQSHERTKFEILRDAIWQVESSGRMKAPRGKAGERGPLQITEPCWIDSRVPGEFSDCESIETSSKVMQAYFERYEPKCLESGDFESLARLWNSGPRWAKKKHLTNGYWRKVKENL
jgi:hypothetical protein